MFLLIAGLFILNQLVLAPFAPPRDLPYGAPNLRNAKMYEQSWGQVYLCSNPDVSFDYSERQVYLMLRNLYICNSSDQKDAILILGYSLYVTKKGQYRGYSAIETQIEYIQGRKRIDTVSWTADGNKWNHNVAEFGLWHNVNWDVNLSKDMDARNIWIINLHNRLLHHRDAGDLSWP